MEKINIVMILPKNYCNDISRVYDWYGKYGLKVIPINYNDMSETISPYDFYFCEDPDKAAYDIDSIRDLAYPFPYWAVKVGPYINIVTLRIVEKEGGITSLLNNEHLYALQEQAATIKTPIGFDFFVKVEHECLIFQLSLVADTFYEFKGYHPDSMIYELIQSNVEEKPYYNGHSLKQIQLEKGIYLILDGFVIVPPSQWYIWKHRKSLKMAPLLQIPNE